MSDDSQHSWIIPSRERFPVAGHSPMFPGMSTSRSPSCSRRRRFALAAITAALAGSVLLSDAGGAVTSWRRFGSGVAAGRGSFGSPYVTVHSTTRGNPEAVRFVIGGSPVRAKISWNLSCWTEDDFDYDSASGSFTARLPYVRDVSRSVRVWRYDHCELDVSAYYLDPAVIEVNLQARYP